MIRWKPFGPYITATLAILASLYYNHTKDVALERSRAVAVAAVASMHDAITLSGQSAQIAAEAYARADSLEHARAITAPAVAKIVAQAPDTCKPVIAALQGQLTQAQREAAERKVAYQDQKVATAALTSPAEHLADATTKLEKATHRSSLVPRMGIGVTAGISPLTRKPDVTVGVTLFWGKH